MMFSRTSNVLAISRSDSRTARGRPTVTARLEERANAALDWLDRNLDNFMPFEKTEGAPKFKPFTELAILYERLTSVRTGGVAKRLQLDRRRRRFRAFLLQHCEDRAYAELGRRMPSYAFALLLPYLALRATGYRSRFHDDTIERMWHTGHLFAAEVLPHRVLDREYFLWKAGLIREPDWRKFYANTILAAARDTLYINRDGAYAITHTLFYLSDWGRKRPSLDEAEIERIRLLVDCLIVHYWRFRHWDLLGELLMNRVSIQAPNSRLVGSASAAFLDAWAPEGYMLGEGREIEGLDKAPPSEHESIVFRECYHATLVGVLYCISALENRA